LNAHLKVSIYNRPFLIYYFIFYNLYTGHKNWLSYIRSYYSSKLIPYYSKTGVILDFLQGSI